MYFNSLDFAAFLPVIFILYWFVFNKKLKLQNILIVIASYIFYGWWDWRFLSLIFFSSVVDFFIGNSIFKNNNIKTRKILLSTSILINLGLLSFFKYYNFFLENFIDAFSIFGIAIKLQSLKIILPVGISFYTFQTLSYTIDIYRKKLKPTTNFINFAAFVSFFPQLVAGPIERASDLLPQFSKKKHFNYSAATDGLRQILWGLFKKMVIADNCAIIANQIFNNSDDYSGSTLLVGAIMFAFQIYGDFSGYSDIAIGTSRLFGFNLKQNFAFPYFSRDFGEFWRRWHISLSTWFRDYIYIPIGGSRGSTLNKIRNIFIIFLLSGFWHGSNWTYIVWGGINAICFLPLIILNKNRKNLDIVASGKKYPSIKNIVSIILTFSFTVLAWVFFRADNIKHAISYLHSIFSSSIFTKPQIYPNHTIKLLLFFIIIEWLGREQLYAIEKIGHNWIKPLRWFFYLILVFLIILFSVKEEQPFIYFQF